MSNARSFLLLALAFTAFLLWKEWQDDARKHLPPAATTTAASPSTDRATIAAEHALAGEVPSASAHPAAPAATAVEPTTEPGAKAPPAPRVVVLTDVLRAVIDTRGGNIVETQLLRYPKSMAERSDPIRLLSDDDDDYFVAQSGLVSTDATAPDHRAQFKAAQQSYQLDAGVDEISVPLTWEDEHGLRVEKTFVFKRGDYVVHLSQQIRNDTDRPLTVNPYLQLQRRAPPKPGTFSFTNPQNYSFVGVAWYSPEKHFEKLKFDEFAKTPLKREIAGGWAAMLQHHFLAAWIPPENEREIYNTTVVETPAAPRFLIRAVGPPLSVAAHAQAATQARLYVGPKLQNDLPKVASGLALTIDYGYVTVLAEPLFWLLHWIYDLVGNWGLAIILLVVLIKAAFFKLSEAQYRSMAKMRKMQPRMAALKERYGDDKEKLNQAMIELYQKEKINPMGGCLPILVQIPVFIALYWVLAESVELRQAPFFGWIHSLSDKDPYFILPLLNGATMWITQKLTPAPGVDPMQAKMMQMMPVMFAVMFAFFPAGLVLYWTVNGLLGLAQQWIITRRIEAGAKA